jgi:hypothetical protein
MTLVTSCQKDNINEESTELKVLSELNSFDEKSAYLNLINNPDKALEIYDQYSEQEATSIWLYKYELFESTNTLSTEQKAAIDDAKIFVIENEITSGDINEEDQTLLITTIEKAFTTEQSLLIYHFENDFIEVKSRPFFGDTFELNQGCHEEFVNGESIGFYEVITVRRYRFGIRTRIWNSHGVPCGTFDFFTVDE